MNFEDCISEADSEMILLSVLLYQSVFQGRSSLYCDYFTSLITF